MKQYLQCPSDNITVFVWLFVLAILCSLALIANPGFYSHDELEKLDFIYRHGFADYLSEFVRFRDANQFEAERPVSFLIEGIVTLFLPAYPILVHLSDVIMHCIVSCLLFMAIIKFNGSRNLAWTSAIIMLINPLTAFSVGWSGALMDRLYILFGLVAFIYADSYLKNQGGWIKLGGILTASTLAILSKETAVILPGVLFIYIIQSPNFIQNKKFWIAFTIWSLPIIFFVLYRLSALFNTFDSGIESPYASSVSNIPEGLFVYLTYPFVPFLAEAHNWALQPAYYIWIAVALHISLLYAIWRVFSTKALLAYSFGYLLFIFPVLFIPIKAAHYLYGSGIAFSIALGGLISLENNSGFRYYKSLSLVLILFTSIHTLVLHNYFYRTGSCMKAIEHTIEGMYMNDGYPEKMTFLVEQDAPGYILRRYVATKKQIGAHFPVSFEVVDWDHRKEKTTQYQFNCDCLVYKLRDQEFTGIHWGPQSTTINTVPNIQPDGSAGIWIQVDDTNGYGELQVQFDGQPANFTVVQDNLITAAISPELFSQSGNFDITVKQITTGNEFPIGTLIIHEK